MQHISQTAPPRAGHCETASEEPEFEVITERAKEKMADVLQDVAVQTVEGYHVWQRGGSASPAPEVADHEPPEPVTEEGHDAGNVDEIWSEDIFNFNFLGQCGEEWPINGSLHGVVQDRTGREEGIDAAYAA